MTGQAIICQLHDDDRCKYYLQTPFFDKQLLRVTLYCTYIHACMYTLFLQLPMISLHKHSFQVFITFHFCPFILQGKRNDTKFILTNLSQYFRFKKISLQRLTVWVSECVWMCVCMHECVHMYVHACMCAYVCVVCSCACVWTDRNIIFTKHVHSNCVHIATRMYVQTNIKTFTELWVKSSSILHAQQTEDLEYQTGDLYFNITSFCPFLMSGHH